MKKRIKILFLLTLKYFKNFKFEKKYLVFLFFLVLSTIFWFLNALDKEYTTFIHVPIKYINVAKSKILSQQEDSVQELQLKINSAGFKILNYNTTFFKKPLYIRSNSKYLSKDANDSLNLVLKTTKLKNLISAHLGEDFKILDIQPDSILFSYENKISKKFPIKSNFDIKYKQQFFQPNPAELSSDSVLVTATKRIIDTLEFVETLRYEFLNVSSDLKFRCDLKKIAGAKFDSSSLQAFVAVEEYTEKTFKSEIEVINLPAGNELQLFPHSVHLKFNISTKDYLKVKNEDFRLIVDYNDINETSNNLKVVLKDKPDYIFDLEYNPPKVEYILEK